MADEDIIKKIARLLDENLGDRDTFGEPAGSSQILSQIFWPPRRDGRGDAPWDFNQPIEVALSEVDRIVALMERAGGHTTPQNIEQAKQTIREYYDSWRQVGRWRWHSDPGF